MPPSADEIAAAAAGAGWRRLEIDRTSRRAWQPGGLWLDFSAVAKGHAVDRLAHVLRRAGIPAALVEIGGELLGYGTRPDGTPWWVDIEPPIGIAGLVPTRVALCGLAIATSGD